MYKSIEIIFPFAENQKANIVFVTKLFVSLREISLEEGRNESLKFLEKNDLVIPISEVNLAEIESYLQSFGYKYRVVHKTLPE
ncbi:hypothetical protein SAMN05421788_106231 [Filimonas lacunae]|uniref:Uncharacterized protein n=1 Tax=Filimonas lacunae TaxID=477680 RepID=A0A1N7QQH6_9BACT|nr:hypothetical protein [Filimonas lacunae]SIT25048.1 hypothetical protein SAMN05421788_106231 [Filimonas lacunae]